MANNINWGKIYGSTWWGNVSNAISWGKSYISLLSNIANNFKTRVLGLGGIVESEECIEESIDASLYLKPSGYADGKVFTALPEDGSGDMDFARVSGATRVNAQGEIESVNTLGDELVTNGTLETILGNELVTNGDFEDGTNSWNFNSFVSASNGVATFTDGGSIIHFPSFTVGKTYEVLIQSDATFDFRTGTSGSDASLRDIEPNAPLLFTATSATSRIQFVEKTFPSTISNISVKEVIEGYIDETELVTNGGFDTDSDWLRNGNVSISNGVGIFTASASGSNLQQVFTLKAGHTYRCEFEIKNYVSGTVKFYCGGTAGTNRDSNGVYTEYITATTNGIFINSIGSAFLTIDNISVKEVVQDNWDDSADSFLTISDGKANFLDCPSGRVIYQDNVFTIGKTYKVTFEVSNLILNGFRLESNTGLIDRYSNGVYTETFIATISRLHIRTLGTTTGSIDNISVKEVIEEGIPRLDYTDGGCPSLLLEPQSTNLITYSEDFSDASWLKDVGLSIDNGYLAPDGTMNASKITGVIGSSYLYFNQTSGHNSIYAKTVSGTGQVHLLDRFSNSGTLKTLTEEWQRFDTDIVNGAYAVDFRGSSTLSEVIVWGAQLEALPYATSYIPTSGGIATREAETLERDNISHLINSEEGVFYAEMKAFSQLGGNRYISLSSNNNANRILLRFQDGAINTFLGNSSGNYGVASYFGDISTQYNKAAVKWKQDDVQFWVNGVLIGSLTSFNTFSNSILNSLKMANADGLSLPFLGHIKDLRIYKTALTDEELTNLTTI